MSSDFDLINSDLAFFSGVDEVGRGPLAGPVVAACVYFDLSLFNGDERSLFSYLREVGVTDSKKITEKKRKVILEKLNIKVSSRGVQQVQIGDFFSITYSISVIPHTKIDEINILNASLLAMEKSFVSCHEFHGKTAGVLVIDGNKALKTNIKSVEQKTLVKGDSKSTLVGLASIIAKDFRDELMKDYGKKYPGYGLERHAGYPTAKHRDAIAELGVLPIHRKSFKGVKEHCEQV